jgi:hypothetical protein
MFWTPSVGPLGAGDNDPMTLLPAVESGVSDADF